MMNYNPYYQSFQNNIPMNQYPNHFVNAMYQNYGQQPQQQNQQQITTQPPILQPQINSIASKILPVTNKEEATVAQVDLINGTPSFFYNKSNGEIYLKQFDVSNGSAIFKTYVETIPPVVEEEPKKTSNYDKEINYLINGIDSLHRMMAEIQHQYPIIEKENINDIETEKIETKIKKRGQ